MADISMCKNNKCPSKNTCYRFTALPGTYRQSYMSFDLDDGEEMCKEYWNNKGKRNVKSS